MATVFCRVTADISPDFVENFPVNLDFLGILHRICEEAGVTVSVSDTILNLQGQWTTIGRVHSMLLSALKVYGQSAAIRKEPEGQIAQGSGSFSALVEAAEAISRGVELQEQVQHEMMRMKTLQSASKIVHAAAPQLVSQEIPFSENDLTETKASDSTTDHGVHIVAPTESFQHEMKYEKPASEINKSASLNKQTKSLAKKRQFGSKKGAVTSGAVTGKELLMDDGTKVSVYDFDVHGNSDTEHDETKEKGYEDLTVNQQLKIVTESEDMYMKPKKTSKKSIFRNTKEKQLEKTSSLIHLKKHAGIVKDGNSAASVYHKTVKKKYTTISKRLKGIRPIDSALKVSNPAKSVVKNENTKSRGRGRPSRSFEHGIEIYLCDQCDFKAKTRNALGDHKHRTHLAKPTKCDLCLKIFPNIRYMKRHRASHIKAPHCCDVCGKMYKAIKALREHKKRHDTDYKPPEFNCIQCSKSFCTQYILQCHIKSEHLGIKKSFLCPTCGKSFTTKHTLQQHLNVHIGARPYSCEVCGKAFSYESALRDHRYVHAGTKKFVCPDPTCLKAFRQRSALKMHEKIHKEHKDFTCDQCGRGFTQKQALQRHIRAHKGLKPFTCKLCGRTFGDASIIRRHMILVHKIHKDPSCWREDIVSNVKADKTFRITTPLEAAILDDDHMKHIDDSGKLKIDELHVVFPHDPAIAAEDNITGDIPVKTSPESEVTFHPVTGEIQTGHHSVASYPAHMLLPLSDPTATILETPPATSDPYSLTVPASSHIEYVGTPTQPPGHYTYTVTNVDPTLYQSASRSTQLIHTANEPGNYMKIITVEDRSGGSVPVQQFDHEQDKDTEKIVAESAEKPLELPTMTVNLQTLKTIEALANAGALAQTPQDAAAGRPTEILVTRPVDAASHSVTDEIAKRLYETAVPENQSLSSLYAYYANLASQYMNIAQHWPQQNQDDSNEQQ